MTVRLGVIGAGKSVRIRHLPEAKSNPDAEPIAVCDTFIARVYQMAEEYQSKAYTNYKEMLKDPDIDSVVIAANKMPHAEMTIDSFNAVKNILNEKPLVTNLEGAQKMIDAAEKNKKQLMICHNKRLEIDHQKSKRNPQIHEVRGKIDEY